MNAKKTIKHGLKSIPLELVSYPNWICWKFVERDGRITKMPVDPRTGKPAKSDDPGTWAPFMVAAKAASQSTDWGVGFQFGNSPFVGIDLDWKTYEGQDVPEGAQKIIDAFDSYTEMSPSGKGCHIIIQADLKPGYKSRVTLIDDVGLEVYSTGRMFTMTGDIAFGYPVPLEKQTELDVLCEALLAKEEVVKVRQSPASVDYTVDSTTLSYALSKDPVLSRLYNGDIASYGNDHSRADSALVMKLAFWLHGNEMLIDEAFRGSALYRAKWDVKHSSNGSTYGQMTIASALSAWNGECFTPSIKEDSNLDAVIRAYADAKFDLLKAGSDVIDVATGHAMTKVATRKVWFELVEFFANGRIGYSAGKGYYLNFGGITGLASVLGDTNYQGLRTRLSQMADLGFARGFGQLDPSDRVSPFVLWLPESPSDLGIMKIKPSKLVILPGARQVTVTKSPKKLAPTETQVIRVRSILPMLRGVAYRLSLGDSSISGLSESTGVSTRAIERNVERLISLGLAEKSEDGIKLTTDFEAAALMEREHSPAYRSRAQFALKQQANSRSPKVRELALRRLAALEDGMTVRSVYLEVA